MSARLRALGIAQGDMLAARQYERLFDRLGFTRDQIDKAIVYGNSLRGSAQDRADQFGHFLSTKLGMSKQEAATAVDVSIGLVDLANEGGGIESLPPLPERTFGAADQRRLDEIRQLRRDNPDEANSKTLELEELELLEAKAGPASPSHRSEAPQPAIKGEDRMQQIRELRRNDPDAYAANAAQLEAEELRLLSGKPARDYDPSLDWRDDPDIWSGVNRLAEIRSLARSDPDSYESNAALQAEQLSLIEASTPSTTVTSTAPAPTAPAAE